MTPCIPCAWGRYHLPLATLYRPLSFRTSILAPTQSTRLVHNNHRASSMHKYSRPPPCEEHATPPKKTHATGGGKGGWVVDRDGSGCTTFHVKRAAKPIPPLATAFPFQCTYPSPFTYCSHLFQRLPAVQNHNTPEIRIAPQTSVHVQSEQKTGHVSTCILHTHTAETTQSIRQENGVCVRGVQKQRAKTTHTQKPTQDLPTIHHTLAPVPTHSHPTHLPSPTTLVVQCVLTRATESQKFFPLIHLKWIQTINSAR